MGSFKIYIFVEKMFAIHFGGHTIQLNSFIQSVYLQDIQESGLAFLFLWNQSGLHLLGTTADLTAIF